LPRDSIEFIQIPTNSQLCLIYSMISLILHKFMNELEIWIVNELVNRLIFSAL